jgi:hypothetical protein
MSESIQFMLLVEESEDEGPFAGTTCNVVRAFAGWDLNKVQGFLNEVGDKLQSHHLLWQRWELFDGDLCIGTSSPVESGAITVREVKSYKYIVDGVS